MDHHSDCGDEAGTVLGTRSFLPVNDSRLALTAFIHEMMDSQSGVEHLTEVASGAAWQALSLFQDLGADRHAVGVSGCLTDSHLLIELGDHLDFHEVLKQEHGLLLETMNLELEALIAEVDEVYFGRTPEGYSIIQLALRRNRP